MDFPDSAGSFVVVVAVEEEEPSVVVAVVLVPNSPVVVVVVAATVGCTFFKESDGGGPFCLACPPWPFFIEQAMHDVRSSGFWTLHSRHFQPFVLWVNIFPQPCVAGAKSSVLGCWVGGGALTAGLGFGGTSISGSCACAGSMGSFGKISSRGISILL